MKKIRPVILLLIGAFLAVLLWRFTKPVPMLPPPPSIESHLRMMENLRIHSEKMRNESAQARTQTPPRMPVLKNGFVPMETSSSNHIILPPETNGFPQPTPVVDAIYASPTNWPDDPRPEAKTFIQFARMARPYNFEPNVIYDKDEEFPQFRKAVGTSTHEAQIDTRNNRIVSFYSYRDRSASLKNYPGVSEGWKNGTGQWDSRQMINETFRILRELGYTDTLAATSRGYRHFITQPWRVTAPDGEFQIIYPFAKVMLYDEFGNRRVIAEYRMGPDGPVGLVDWNSLY
jgi:hypothetical protein